MKICGKKIDATNLIIHILFLCLTLLMIYPFISMLSVSLTPEEELIHYGYKIWPAKPNLDAYKVVQVHSDSSSCPRVFFLRFFRRTFRNL